MASKIKNYQYINWNDSYVKILIELWAENYDSLISTKRNSAIYAKMSQSFSTHFNIDPPIHPTCISQKVSNLRKRFRIEKLRLLNSGESAWWAFSLIKEIIGEETFNDSSLPLEADAAISQLNNTSEVTELTPDNTELSEALQVVLNEMIFQPESSSSTTSTNHQDEKESDKSLKMLSKRKRAEELSTEDGTVQEAPKNEKRSKKDSNSEEKRDQDIRKLLFLSKEHLEVIKKSEQVKKQRHQRTCQLREESNRIIKNFLSDFMVEFKKFNNS